MLQKLGLKLRFPTNTSLVGCQKRKSQGTVTWREQISLGLKGEKSRVHLKIVDHDGISARASRLERAIRGSLFFRSIITFFKLMELLRVFPPSKTCITLNANEKDDKIWRYRNGRSSWGKASLKQQKSDWRTSDEEKELVVKTELDDGETLLNRIRIEMAW